MTEEQSLEEKEKHYFNMLESVTTTASEAIEEIKEAGREVREDNEKMLSNFLDQIGDRAKQIDINREALLGMIGIGLFLISAVFAVLCLVIIGNIAQEIDPILSAVLSFINMILVIILGFKAVSKYQKIVTSFIE